MTPPQVPATAPAVRLTLAQAFALTTGVAVLVIAATAWATIRLGTGIMLGVAGLGAIAVVFLAFTVLGSIERRLQGALDGFGAAPASGDPLDAAIEALATARRMLDDTALALEAVAGDVTTDADAAATVGMNIGMRSRNQLRAIATASTASLAVDRHVRDVTKILAEFSQSGDASATPAGDLATALPPGRIGRVVEAIRSTAEQAELLSLNAAIEAARVGPPVRGFAVVAEEVRRIAERTGSSTGEMSDLASRALPGAHAFRPAGSSGGPSAASAPAPTPEVSSLPANSARAHREAAAIITRSLEAVTRDARANAEAAEALDLASDALRTQAVTLRTLSRALVRPSV